MRSQCGASVGNTKDTSGVWLYVVEVEADDAGKNVKCMVKDKAASVGVASGARDHLRPQDEVRAS